MFEAGQEVGKSYPVDVEFNSAEQLASGVIAVFDTNVGYLLWLGAAKDHTEAVRATEASVGLWETFTNINYVLERADNESLLVMDVTGEQGLALQKWADNGFKSLDFPEDLPNGTTYNSGEVLEMVEHT